VFRFHTVSGTLDALGYAHTRTTKKRM